MTIRLFAVVSRWVPVVLVAGLLPLVPVQVQIAALAFVVLHGASVLRGTRRLLLLAALTGIIVPPLIAELLWPSPSVVLLALPGLPWLESILRTVSEAAVDEPGPLLRITNHRSMTSQAAGLVLGLLAVVLVGTVTSHLSIVGGGVIALAFVGALLALSFSRIPVNGVTARPATLRVMAHNALESPVTLEPRARVRTHLLVEPHDAWASVSPNRALGTRGPVTISLRITPPLAGSKALSVTVRCMDPWGLTVTLRQVTVAHVVVIPRASYVAHLARAYLEQTAGGSAAIAMVPQTQDASRAQRGLDYYGARRYEPGDPLRDVFWKHTLKLRQLVVKERRGEHGQPVVVAVNIWASDPAELDETASATLGAALTLAREDVPIVFAAYTDEAIVSVTPVLTPRHAVLHALHLVGSMREVARPIRVLQPVHLGRLRRRLERLLAVQAAPAARLARVLQFEYRAHTMRAQRHPAYQAVSIAAGKTSAPAVLVVTSHGPDDPEAIELALDHLRTRGIHALNVHRPGMRWMTGRRAIGFSPLP